MKLYKYIGHQDDNELLNIIENIFKDNTLKVTKMISTKISSQPKMT